MDLPKIAGPDVVKIINERIQQEIPIGEQRVVTSVDAPFSEASKNAICCGGS